MTQLAARTGVSDTYPNPSNAVAKAALAAMWDVINEMSQAAELDLASAATTNIGGQAARKLRITGTTGITSFGTTYHGPIVLRFGGALTITHHATTLICPGGVNLITEAGDTCFAIPKCTTSGTFDGWMIIGYERATGGGKVTVASATTPNIWVGENHGTIDYTGTATATGFAAAPFAGAQRKLICAGDCLFTAGTNLLIEGIPSNKTITLAAGALVDVVAITPTQFRMTYSVAGTAVVSVAGFTVGLTPTIRYSVRNGIATISTGGLNNINGTSNATSFIINNIPYQCITLSLGTPETGVRAFPVVTVVDNGVYGYGLATINGTQMVIEKGPAGGAWTASGQKALSTSEFSWRVSPST